MASTIGTAPRSPAQERNARSRQPKPWKSVETKTATGRATNVSTAVSAIAAPATGPRRLGKTSSPSTTNSVTCATNASPSWKVTIERRSAMGVLPIQIATM